MEQRGDLKLYTLEEVTDEIIGKKGTAERDEFDRDVEEALKAYHLGETIKEVRKEQDLTQEALGERIGVKKAQISKIENGQTMTLRTMSRVFRALGITSGELLLSNGQKLHFGNRYFFNTSEILATAACLFLSRTFA